MTLPMDKDTLVVTNETSCHLPFRSTFAITSGIYYYEILFPLTGGEARFGWATRETKLRREKKIGDDQHSIGLEVSSSSSSYNIYHQKRILSTFTKMPPSPAQSSPIVIGCLIDADSRLFQFYVNRQQQQVQSLDTGVHYSAWPYYATVSLDGGQQCQLNFGQVPFEFALRDLIQYCDFNNQSSAQQYQLAKTIEYDDYFWFAHHVIDNHRVNLFYCDPKQAECDELVRQLEHNNVEQNSSPNKLDHSVECGRLVQSVIEVVERRLSSDPTDLMTRWVREVIEGIKWDSYFEKARLLELIYPYFQLSITAFDYTKCHNISLIVLLLYYNNSLKYESIENFEIFFAQTFKAFLKPKIFLLDPWTIIYALNCLKHHHHRHPATMQALLNDPVTMSTLWWCGELFGQVSSVSQLYEPSCDLVRLQAGVCAKWFRDHVMGTGEKHNPSLSTLNPDDMEGQIKLSRDCLSARNVDDDDGASIYHWKSVRSVCSVSSDSFYYEAVLLTRGKMRFGWSTKETDLAWNVNGANRYSIGFDGSDHGAGIFHQAVNFVDNSIISNLTTNWTTSSSSRPRWSVGDVVGCLIDCNRKTFQFYLNGKLITRRDKFTNKYGREYSVHFSSEPYYATVSLHPRQQCYLNLGQCPFRHPPSVPFRTFHQVSPIMQSPNRLYSPRLSECYPLVPVLTKDRVELLFDDDDTEKKSDQLVDKLKEKFSSFNLKSAADDKVRLRLIQSVVEVSGTVDTCIDAHASWIARFINQSTSDNPEFLDLIAQLLYPYFTLHLTNETVDKHRNICIILASLATMMEADLKARVNLYQQVVTYLTQIVIKCHDPVTLLFAIICLGNMNLHEIDKQEIHTNCLLMNKLNDIQSVALPLSSSSFSIQQDSYLGQQINFIVEWFIFTVLQATTVNDPSQVTLSSSETKLDQSNKSEHLKLSVNLLTARSDGLWQSVKSIFCIKPVVYYEVTLHTSGPMRIGWTTNQSDIRHNLLGSDEYSIGFDGHSRVIWHENKQYRVKAIHQWKAGDTVGCFIGQGYFVFQLNGREIATPQLVYFSSRPYFAAASLSTFQQCSFNFTKTKHPPKRRNFMHFDSIRKARNAYIKARKHGQIYNSIVLYGSKMLSGDIKMIQQCPSCDNNNSTNEQDQVSLLTTENIIEEEDEENTQQQQFDEDDESSN